MHRRRRFPRRRARRWLTAAAIVGIVFGGLA